MSFLKKLKGNTWAKVADTALGYEKYAYLRGIARGEHGFKGSDAATSVSAYRTYQKDGRDQERALKNQEERAQTLRELGIENDVKGIRSQFGLFDGDPATDPAHKAVADASASSMNEAHDHYRTAYLNYFNPQLDDQYNIAMTRAKWTGVDRGTDGGSADQVRQRPILTRYVDSRQKVAAGADAGVQSLIDQEQAGRLRLEDRARNGLAPEYAVQDELSGLGRNLDRANSQIPSQTLGDVFGAGAGLYSGYQAALGDAEGHASGRRGSSAGLFEGSGSGSGGRYDG